MDTTLVIIALAFAKPDFSNRRAEIKTPSPKRPEVVVVADVKPPQEFTTCYESRSGSCWTED